MKKTLLFIFCSTTLAVASFAQSLTQANEPSIGESNSMFLCDSLTPDLAGVVGSGVTWDYSSLTVYPGEMRTISIDNPAASPYAADFPSAQKVWNLGGFMHTFFTGTSGERTSYGFVYTAGGTGDVIARWNANSEILMTYDFSYGSLSVDAFSGTATAMGNNVAATGTGLSQIDGSGTLVFPSNTVSNVIRYHITDTARATTFFGEIVVIRNQYEYYDVVSQNLPIFVHASVDMTLGGSPVGPTQHLVLSQFQNTAELNNTNNVEFGIYPNPVKNELYVTGSFDPESKVIILDLQGKEVFRNDLSTNECIIDVKEFEKGFYIVSVISNGVSSSKKIIVE